MPMAFESEANNTPKTASGRHLISDYANGQGRWYFNAGVQSTPAEFGAVDPYDPTDYFSFRHLDGLKKVNWNMSFLTGNLWNFEEADTYGGVYNLNIAPSGAFAGKSVSVMVKTGFANYMTEWYEYNEAWRQVDSILTLKWNALHHAGKDTTLVDAALSIHDDLLDLLTAIPGATSAELDTIEHGIDDLLDISPQGYEESAAIRALASDFREMATGWDRLHYYLGNSDKEVFLKDMSERTTWKVKGDGLGYVAFSGGVTLYNSMYDFEFGEAFVPQNWYLEVQSESKPKKHSTTYDAGALDTFDGQDAAAGVDMDFLV